MLSARIDRTRLIARTRAMVKASPEARLAGARILVHRVISTVVQTEHRDTNRWVNGWALAANAVGAGPIPVRGLNKSSVWGEMYKRLRKQVSFWGFIVQRYERQDRRDRHRIKAEEKLHAAEAKLDDFLSRDDGAVIGFNLRGRGKENRDFSFRHKVYGGTGRVVTLGERSYLELHNREAHTTMVEWRFRILKRAQAMVRGSGLHKVNAAYLKKVQMAFALKA